MTVSCENSLDGVSDRDYCSGVLLSCLSILMMHLSRFSEEIILWSSWEFKFVELDDAYTTGSSIMPQKKNSGYGGTGTGENRAGLRRSYGVADHAEGSAL